MFKKLFKSKKSMDVYAPAKGQCVDIETVSDAAFAAKAMGDGIAVLPIEGLVTAPCNGKITMFFPTKHAFGLQADNGMEILVHIVIDTVKAKGEGFTTLKKEGDIIQKGDTVVTFDLETLKKNYEMPVMMVVTNAQPFKKEHLNQHVTNEEIVFSI